jgi:hypothetical protein
MRSTGTPIAAATIWQVIWAQAANVPSNRSPEQAAVPAPPTPWWAWDWYIALPMSIEQDKGVDSWLPLALKVIRDALASWRYFSFKGFWIDFKSNIG